MKICTILYLNILDPVELEFVEEVFEYNDVSMNDGEIEFVPIEAPVEEITVASVELEIAEIEINLPEPEVEIVEVETEVGVLKVTEAGARTSKCKVSKGGKEILQLFDKNNIKIYYPIKL